MKFRRPIFVALTLAAILSLYFCTALARMKFYPSPASQSDQGAYLDYARAMHDTNYAVLGGRARMPAYSFLLSFFYRPGISDHDWLELGQTFNVCLSTALLFLLFFLYRRHFPDGYSLILIALTAFGVFIYHAPSVQAELLYYFLSFCMFLAFWRMLSAPSFAWAIWSGAIAGVAYLTKASVLPALAVFAVAFILKMFSANLSATSLRRGIISLALVVAAVLLVVSPYIRTSKRVFGQYFYNVNSTFYVWCDSVAETKVLLDHGDREGWPALPHDQIPTASKYWREHSLAQILSRLGHGILRIGFHDVRIEGYYKYGVLFAGVAIALALRRQSQFRALFSARWPLAFFLAAFFAGYFILYSWYAPISHDSRFISSLFLPFTFAASKLIRRLGRDDVTNFAGKKLSTLTMFAAVLIFFTTVDFLYLEVGLWHRRARADFENAS